MNNPLTLTVSLTDPALNLTVKRVIHFDAQDRPSTSATLTADALEELHSLLAIAQNQAADFQEPLRCPVCGLITQSHAASIVTVLPNQICHCPNPPTKNF